MNLLNGEIRNYQLFMKNTSSTLSIYDFRIWIADWFDNQDDNSAPITTLVKDFNRPYINNDQNYHSNSKSIELNKIHESCARITIPGETFNIPIKISF